MKFQVTEGSEYTEISKYIWRTNYSMYIHLKGNTLLGTKVSDDKVSQKVQ